MPAIKNAAVLLIVLACCVPLLGQANSVSTKAAPKTTSPERFLISPPTTPMVVHARFTLQDLNEITEGTETFEFRGVMTLTWQDPRQAFDPAVIGANEKVYQGAYQVNEVSTGWFPQVMLVNESGLYQTSATTLRILPDGTSTLIETINAVAESEVDMSRFPFDRHRLKAVFEVLGFDKNEVALQVEPDSSNTSRTARVPQWLITGISTTVEDHAAPYAGKSGFSSAMVVGVEVRRLPFYAIRLVVFPLMVIVLLSFSVFWMDTSSLGDRLSVSFIGVLTAVAYLLVTSDQLPRISYVTLMHGFVNLSFIMMCATVVINLIVGTLDKRGQVERGNRIDQRCRWIFPLSYIVLLLLMLAVALLFF